jgi:hypothetical protein
MAKSKNGGTRSFIRGRIGSDVYSVGKDGKGARQQVVRSLAEQVSNPRSSAQMFGRMVMSTVMQAVSALKPIIDHSFDGMATGQPSISEFIRRNYALVKADAEAHPSADNEFALNKYQEKGVLPGKYIVSNGSVLKPADLVAGPTGATIVLTNDTLTVRGLKNALGLSADGYFTMVLVDADNGAIYSRARLNQSLADETVISAANVNTLFTFEGNATATVTLNDTNISIAIASGEGADAYGIIVSEKIAGAWQHSQCVLSLFDEAGTAADVALPTYPTGAQMFLNGGDL